MPQSSKIWLIVLGVVLVAVIGSSFFLSKQLNTVSPVPSANTSSRTFPTDVVAPHSLPSGYSVAYQSKDDNSGRTVIYIPYPYFKENKGVGVKYMSDGKTIAYQLGVFRGWESITGSKDRYILTENPYSKEQFPKFRVAFSPSSFVQTDQKTTMIRVIDLTRLDRPSKEYFQSVRAVDAFTQSQINGIIKNGDVVFVLPYYESENHITKDDKGIPLVAYMILRRFGGKDALLTY